jgi:hypothetical protein
MRLFETVKTLEFPFYRSGFTHELVERNGMVCLVRRSTQTHSHYEVVNLRVEPDKEWFGNFYPEHERYPSDEQWGTHGFTYLATDLERAQKRFEFCANLHSAVLLRSDT